MTHARAAAPAPADRRTRLLLWAVWLAMLLVALASIARWGRNVPLAEDWVMVAPLTGHQPSLAGWLWAQNNEHRMPLSRLVYLGLLEVTRGDFRSGMVANALVLAAAAAALMRTAWRIRGRAHWADAFFPVALLHLGNWENIVWGWQLQFTLSTVLTLAGLVAIAWDPPPVRPRRAAAMAATLVLLPLCGANGLIYTLALAAWALYAGVRQWRDADPAARAAGRLLAGGAAAGVLLVALYFVGYERPSWVPANPGRLETARTGLKFLAYAFGPAAAAHWNPAIAAALLVLLPSLALVLWAGWRTRGPEQTRALGLLCFAGGAVVLSAALAWGRAGYMATAGLPTRYVLLSATALCGVYLVWLLYAPAALRAWLPAALCTALVLLLPANTRRGFEWRDWYVTGMRAVERDVAAGVPRAELARRHREFLLHWNEQLLASSIGWLREAGMGPLRGVRE